ncbi:SipW-dependent-type signal peptide-containing protein [Raineyella sp. LH-20]|uniref:SipW-dependent-type signal peptide-containing protein n=1 Tax=Raineyella sp. LH-20 TaxID=3081204 RepID=UPI002954B43E|nr:SipW-dependent-type signal peptide-containing protein [Raineyella sp. LH-20]WOP19807.1 SipW-dependent-type signal peptide-containing protein [Raineyella sp. LH-20]
MSDNTSTRWTRSHKIRALLAGGVVLGVGAAVTLAAWNDSEFAQGDFTAGTFNLEGSTDGTTYAQHSTSAAAALVFDSTTYSGNITPDDVLYKAFWVRLDSATTSDATLGLATTTPDPTTGTNADHLSYDIYQLAAGDTCDAATVSTATAVWSGATLSARPAIPPTIHLTKGATTGTAGTAVQLCVKVTAGPEGSLVQGGPASTVWEFKATSVS